MTAPDRPPLRSGSSLVVGMLVVIVLIIWSFDLVVSVFGPPDEAMQLTLLSERPGEVEVLVRPQGQAAWTRLLGGADAPLARAEERSVWLLAGGEPSWTLAWRDASGELARYPLRFDAERQLRLRLDAEGALFVRDGPASLPLARSAHLPERLVRAERPPEEPPLPTASEPLAEASDSWAFGRPRGAP